MSIVANPNFIEFFEWAQAYLDKHNKCIQLVNRQNISYESGKCSGWCDGQTIAVAIKNPLAEEVFVHEFCHMNQAIEKSQFWKEDYDFWTLLEKKQLDIKHWDKIMDVIALERDCEKRALALSKKWSLFDNEDYAQKANAYLFYYHFIFLKQKWMDSTSIYHPFILEEMRKKLLPLNYFNDINMELMNLYNDCLDKKGKFYKKAFT